VNLISKQQLPTMALGGMDLEAMVGGEDPLEGGVDMAVTAAMVGGEAGGEDGDGAILATFGVKILMH